MKLRWQGLTGTGGQHEDHMAVAVPYPQAIFGCLCAAIDMPVQPPTGICCMVLPSEFWVHNVEATFVLGAHHLTQLWLIKQQQGEKYIESAQISQWEVTKILSKSSILQVVLNSFSLAEHLPPTFLSQLFIYQSKNHIHIFPRKKKQTDQKLPEN